MKKQTQQQPKTQGKTTNRISNKDKHQTNNKKSLDLKSGILVQTRRRPLWFYGLFSVISLELRFSDLLFF